MKNRGKKSDLARTSGRSQCCLDLWETRSPGLRSGLRCSIRCTRWSGGKVLRPNPELRLVSTPPQGTYPVPPRAAQARGVGSLQDAWPHPLCRSGWETRPNWATSSPGMAISRAPEPTVTTTLGDASPWDVATGKGLACPLCDTNVLVLCFPHRWDGVLACSGCHNKEPQTGQFKALRFIPPGPGGWRSEIRRE